MTRHSTKASSKTTRRPTSNKKVVSALAICPTDGAGWCPYPFSPAQLAKRLQEKANANQSVDKALTTSAGRQAQAKHH